MSEYAKNIQTIEDMWKKRIELRVGRTDGIMTELLPCPFCGGEAELHPTYDMDTGDVDGWFVWCNSDACECKPETGQFFTEAEAIAAWNSRAERTCECIMCAYFENKSTCGAYCNYFDRELGDDYDGGCAWGVLSGCKVVGE